MSRWEARAHEPAQHLRAPRQARAQGRCCRGGSVLGEDARCVGSRPRRRGGRAAPGLLEGHRAARHLRAEARVHLRDRSLEGWAEKTRGERRRPGEGRRKGQSQRPSPRRGARRERRWRVRSCHRGDFTGVEADGRARGGESGARRGPACAQVRLHRRGRLPLPVRHRLQSRRARGVARFLCLRLLLAGRRSRWTAPDGLLERYPSQAGQSATARRSRPHRREARRAHARSAQAEVAARPGGLRSADGRGLHRRHLHRGERPPRPQEVQLPGRAPGKAGRLQERHAH